MTKKIYSQKKKWSIEAESEMIQMLELSDKSWKHNMINMWNDLLESM